MLFALVLKVSAEHAVAEVPRLGAVVLEHGRLTALAGSAKRRVCAGRCARATYSPLTQVEDRAVFAVEARGAARLHLLDRLGERDAVLLHAVASVSAKPSASQVSNGPSSQL